MYDSKKERKKESKNGINLCLLLYYFRRKKTTFSFVFFFKNVTKKKLLIIAWEFAKKVREKNSVIKRPKKVTPLQHTGIEIAISFFLYLSVVCWLSFSLFLLQSSFSLIQPKVKPLKWHTAIFGSYATKHMCYTLSAECVKAVKSIHNAMRCENNTTKMCALCNVYVVFDIHWIEL